MQQRLPLALPRRRLIPGAWDRHVLGADGGAPSRRYGRPHGQPPPQSACRSRRPNAVGRELPAARHAPGPRGNKERLSSSRAPLRPADVNIDPHQPNVTGQWMLDGGQSSAEFTGLHLGRPRSPTTTKRARRAADLAFLRVASFDCSALALSGPAGRRTRRDHRCLCTPRGHGVQLRRGLPVVDRAAARPVTRSCGARLGAGARFVVALVSQLSPKWHSKRLLRTEPLQAMVVAAFVPGLSMRDVESLCEQAGLGSPQAVAVNEPARAISRRGPPAHEGDRPVPRRDQSGHFSGLTILDPSTRRTGGSS